MIKRNKGFTLIELLVVIAIIGILSSVVLASLNTARQKARDARRISDIKNLQLALELYADDNSGNYPVDIIDLADDGYIPRIATDPNPSVGAYLYSSGSGGVRGNEYHIGTILERSDMPENDKNCDSLNGGVCFADPMDNGFDGDLPNVYDLDE